MTTGGDVRHLEDQPSAQVIRDLDFLLKGVGGEMALGVERRVRKRRNLSTTMGHSTGLIREQCPVW